MILKYIQCQVALERRGRFSHGQLRWDALRAVDGFIGQLGGWNTTDVSQAVILGFWQGADAYENFMQNIHNDIYKDSDQHSTIQASTLSLWCEPMTIPGSLPSIAAALPVARLLRIAQCEVHPGRVDHFEKMQKTVWNPGMGGADGCLIGLFTRCVSRPGHYLVASLWASREDHEVYRQNTLPGLRLRAEPEHDCPTLEGSIVEIVPQWTLVPSSF